jgi:[ribosomal protein S18]-alanine N-acetyltransferase
MGLIHATPSHAEVLALIHGASFPPGEAWDAASFATHLALPGCFGLIDSRGGLLLGQVAADEAEVLTLAVVPALRRQGCASALLRAAEAWATEAGARRIFLEVSVSNTAARALYAAHGFAEVGLRRRYYPDGSDAVVLRADLSPGAAKDG